MLETATAAAPGPMKFAAPALSTNAADYAVNTSFIPKPSTGFGAWVKENPALASTSLQAMLGVLQGREQMGYQRQLDEERRRKEQAIAEMFAPLVQYQLGRVR